MVGVLLIGLHLGVSILLLLLQLLLLLEPFDVGASVLVEIELEVLHLVEVLVGVWQELAVLLDLLDLVQVFPEYFGGVVGALPAGGLFNDLLYHLVLDHFADVDLVVGLLEDAVLAGVLDLHVIEQLEPEVLQLVSVVLEEVEIVSDGGENLVKLGLQLASVVFGG